MRLIKDTLHEDVRLPNETTCPYCGAKMNNATSRNTSIVQDGDYGLCVGCTEIVISVISVNGEHTLRKTTEHDIEEAKQTDMYDLLMEYRELLQAGNHGLKVKR